jgi:hypothetical protein
MNSKKQIGKMPPPRDTHSNQLKMFQPEAEEKERFIMKRFKDVPSRI